ncbi:MAG: UDP-N-acetylmuramate--L-alanine ligase [Anaerolineales bacterium]|nr:MAG: UDP-N-acetylmuramate--L-alanine ligase [Anaerolineales bacterium]
MSQSTHFIGIGGTGLSAIARVLLERGEHISGSDREASPLGELLSQAGVKVSIGHAAANINGATRVVRSSAVGEDNVEVQAARAKGIPVYKRSEFLEHLLADQQVIAVAGSHGKTTTTAMLAWLLTALNQRPGYIIGSLAANLGANAAAGGGRLFVIEADEYDYMFLGLRPRYALVTNVEHDHPDMFATPADFQAAFERFVDRLQPDGELIACADDAGAAALLAYAAERGHKTSRYAHSHERADYRMEILSTDGAGYNFAALHDGQELARVQMQVPGLHNALNALGALAVAHKLGLNMGEAALALADFRGTSRRFEVRGDVAGVTVVDDYAHHPSEIRTTLAAARARYAGRRILAVWQPHTYSRTQTLAADYASAFGDADRVLVLDVYAAREQRPADFSLEKLVAQIPRAAFTPTFAQTQQALLAELTAGDVLVVMSAGDAIQLSADVFAGLQDKESKHA